MRTVKSGRLNFLEFETKILISYLYTDLQSLLRENIDLRLSVRIISKTVMSKTFKNRPNTRYYPKSTFIRGPNDCYW